jgi:hypothetical protein
MWVLILITLYGSDSVMAQAVKSFETADLCETAKTALYAGEPRRNTEVYLCLVREIRPDGKT